MVENNTGAAKGRSVKSCWQQSALETAGLKVRLAGVTDAHERSVKDRCVLSGGQDSKGLPGRRNCVDQARWEATACGIQADTMVETEAGEEGPGEETGLQGSAGLRGRGGGMSSGLRTRH